MEHHPKIQELRNFALEKISKEKRGVIRRFFEESLQVVRQDLARPMGLMVAKRTDDDGFTIFVNYSDTPADNIVCYPCDMAFVRENIERFIRMPVTATLSPMTFVGEMNDRLQVIDGKPAELVAQHAVITLEEEEPPEMC